MIIRYAEMTDYPWLTEHEAFITGEMLEQKIRLREIYMAVIDGCNAGWLRYNFFWDNVPFMNKLFLLKHYRRQGIGTALVRHWENEMKHRGYKHVMTSTLSTEDARHFFRKTGYTIIGGFTYMKDPFEMLLFKNL